MTRPSQIPVVKTWFIDLLREHNPLADIEANQGIIYGRKPDEPHECIPVTDVDGDWSMEWVGAGQDRQRDERFGLVFYVIVKTPGLAQQEATERAFEIFGAIEEITVENATTQGEIYNVFEVAIEPVDFSEIPHKEGYWVLIEARLRTHARI